MMKKTLSLVIIFLMIVIQNVFSYDDYEDEEIKNKSMFGIKAGVNLASYSGDQINLSTDYGLIDPTSKLGVIAGAFYEHKFSSKFAVQPELLFTMKGADFDAEEYVQSHSLWYLEIPILFKSIFEMKDNIMGEIFIGASIAYNIKSSWSAKFNDVYLNEDDPLYDISPLDFGGIIGGSFSMKSGQGRLLLDLRYTYGLSSNRDKVKTDTYNGVISIMVGYKFDINF